MKKNRLHRFFFIDKLHSISKSSSVYSGKPLYRIQRDFLYDKKCTRMNEKFLFASLVRFWRCFAKDFFKAYRNIEYGIFCTDMI